MEYNKEMMEMVEKARLGDEVCLEALAGKVRLRLYNYVHRMTLDADLSDELVQESLMNMCKKLGTLKKLLKT